jgi:Spy/CpxP family protein refolding chaperone
MTAMKNALKAAGLAAIAAGLVFAQAPVSPVEPGSPGHRFEGHKGARRGNWRMLMRNYLGLTDQQKAKAETIFSNERNAARPVREQLRQARAEMRSAIQNGKPVNRIAAGEGNLLGKLAGIRASAAEQFRGILTPQQLQKLQQLHAAGHQQG